MDHNNRHCEEGKARRGNPDSGLLRYARNDSIKGIARAVLCIFFILTSAAHAASLFTFTATVDGDTTARAFTGAESALRALEGDQIDTYLPGYTDTSALDATLNYRGVPISFAFADSSNTLHLTIPSLGVDETFVGSSRDDAVNQMVRYVQQGRGTLAALQRSLAANSPVEPIAGNPSSLMSMLVDESFADDVFDSRLVMGRAFSTKADSRLRPPSARSFGLTRTTFEGSGLSGTSWTAPFNFTLKPHAKTTVKIGLPMRIMDVDGAKSISGGARVAVQTRLDDHWTLTPSAGWGVTASTDLGSVGHVVNFALGSRYEIPFRGRSTIVVGNMIGYAKTLGMSLGDYDFDPNLNNLYLKNGVQLELPVVRMFGHTGAIKGSYALSNYFGSELYLDSVHEFGLGLGGGGIADVPISFEAKRIYGNDYSATSLGANLRF